jgi:DNA-directed RNA polymerase I, II, and III subunit RPABC1
MDFQEKEKLYKIRKTVIEMLTDRNIHVPDSEKITFEEFTIKYNNKNIDIYFNDGNKNIYIYFHIDTKNFSKSDLKTLIQKIVNEYENEDINLILLLGEKDLNSAVSKELEKEMYKNVEIFFKNKMIFNITHHSYVPKHIVLNKEEETELLEKYYTIGNKLPEILRTDPIAKYYGMKPKQICKIMRNSPEVGTYPYYRIVR